MHWLVEGELDPLEAKGVDFEYLGSAALRGFGGTSAAGQLDLLSAADGYLPDTGDVALSVIGSA